MSDWLDCVLASVTGNTVEDRPAGETAIMGAGIGDSSISRVIRPLRDELGDHVVRAKDLPKIERAGVPGCSTSSGASTTS